MNIFITEAGAGLLRELERIITQSKQRSAQEHQPLSGSHTALCVRLNSLLTGRGRPGINGLLWLSLDLWPLMSPEDKWEDGAVKQEEFFFLFKCLLWLLTESCICSGFIHAFVNLPWEEGKYEPVSGLFPPSSALLRGTFGCTHLTCVSTKGCVAQTASAASANSKPVNCADCYFSPEFDNKTHLNVLYVKLN